MIRQITQCKLLVLGFFLYQLLAAPALICAADRSNGAATDADQAAATSVASDDSDAADAASEEAPSASESGQLAPSAALAPLLGFDLQQLSVDGLIPSYADVAQMGGQDTNWSGSQDGTTARKHVAEDANQSNTFFPPWAMYSTRNVDARIRPNAGLRIPQLFPNFSPVVPDYDPMLLTTRNFSLKVSLAEFGVSENVRSAKFEEFRDVRDGAVAGVEAHYRDLNYYLNVVGRNLGRRDEDLNVEGGVIGKYLFSFVDDETPHNYMFGARSLYNGVGTGDLSIAYGIRADIQNSTSIGQAATKLATYDAQQGQSVDLALERERMGGEFTLMATYPWIMKIAVSDESRDGERPWSGSFGFSDFVEIPWAVHYDTHEFKITEEWAKPESRVYFTAGFRASLFDNHVESQTFSNPFRVTDSADLVGSYDGGPAEGRIALYPSNQYYEPSATLVVKRLAWDSDLSAVFSAGVMRQNETLLPFSTNTADVLTNTAGLTFNATDPAGLPRPTSQAGINTESGQARWTARPTEHLHLNTEYRIYRMVDVTPPFIISEFVREDQDIRTPGTPGGTFSSVQLGYVRQDATIETTYDFGHNRDNRLGITYTWENWDRHDREVKYMDDNRTRISYDTKAKKWLDLKSWYEHTIRTTSHYLPNQWHVIQGDPLEVTALPQLRKIDEAAYNKDDLQVMATVPIGSAMSFSAHGLYGKTNYTGQTFGLLDNSHQSYGFDYSYAANDRLSFFAEYTFEKFHNRLRDRTWTPGSPSDPYTMDPGYFSFSNWEGVPEDHYNVAGAGMDAYLIPKRFHYTLNYTYSQSHGIQNYSSPLGPATVDLNAFTPLNFDDVDSTVYNTLNQELEYKFKRYCALSAGYQFESWHIDDYNYNGFNYVNQFAAFNFIPLPGANLLMGGLLPPSYHANVAYARLRIGW